MPNAAGGRSDRQSSMNEWGRLELVSTEPTAIHNIYLPVEARLRSWSHEE